MRKDQLGVVVFLGALSLTSLWLAGSGLVEKPRHAEIESDDSRAVQYTSSELPSDAVIVNSDELTAEQTSQLYASIDDPRKEVDNTAGLTNDSFVSSDGSFYRVEVMPRGSVGMGSELFELLSFISGFLAMFFTMAYVFDWNEEALRHDCGAELSATDVSDDASYWVTKQELPERTVYYFRGECPMCREELDGTREKISVPK